VPTSVARDVRVKTGDGTEMTAPYSPASSVPAPGILVLHEIFGMTEFILSRLPLFNAYGYAAMVPALYHRIDPGASYDYAGEEWERAFATRNSLNDDLAMEDIGAAIDALAAQPECNGEVVVVGYCLGGLLAVLSATRLNAAANICFHGVRLEKHLEEAETVLGPFQIHFPSLDKYAPPETVARVKAALPTRENIECLDYPDADHGFSRVGQPVFSATATAQAHAAMFSFIDRVTRQGEDL
jgi:carboxymethylenebutenolidase